MTDYLQWQSFREIDQSQGLPKGSAFRAFKRIEWRFVQGRDYLLLTPGEQRETIDLLRAADRIYGTSVNVVLLAPTACAQVLAELRQPAGEP